MPERYNLVEKMGERPDENWFVTRYVERSQRKALLIMAEKFKQAFGLSESIFE